MKTTITLLTLLMTVASYSQERPESRFVEIEGVHSPYEWGIHNYQEKAETDSLRLVSMYKRRLEQAEEYKPSEKPKEMKKQGWFSKNVIDTKEKERARNEELKEQQKIYQEKIDAVNETFDRQIKSLQEYRDKWAAFAKVENKRIREEKEQREIAAEKKRIQNLKDAKIAEEKAAEEQERREAEWKAMPTNPQYLQWKSNYEKVIALAQANVDNCEAIIKKYTFKNAFGQKMYDSSDFSESDKKAYNKTLDLLAEHNNKIGDLEEEKNFYFYWNESVSMHKSTSSYRLSSYYNSKNKVY